MHSNPIKIGVVEDEILIADSICIALENCGYLVAEPACSYEEAIALLENEKIDLMILDINLKSEKDGVTIAHLLNEKYHIPFIFLTANADIASIDRAKQTNPLAFLVKPFQQQNLFASIEVCLFNYSQKSKETTYKEHIFIKHKNVYTKLIVDDIIYLQSNHVYVDIYTNKNKLMVRMSLTEIMEQLNPKKFVQVHRSFVVNKNKVKQFSNHYVELDQIRIPVSKSFESNLLRFNEPN